MEKNIELRADRFRFLKFHLTGAILTCIVGYILFNRFLGIFIACLLTAVPILLIDTKKYNIILKNNSLEGPMVVKTKRSRISARYDQIDLSKSKRATFFKGGSIALKDGRRISIYNLYFNGSKTEQLFKEIEKRLHGGIRGH